MSIDQLQAEQKAREYINSIASFEGSMNWFPQEFERSRMVGIFLINLLSSSGLATSTNLS